MSVRHVALLRGINVGTAKRVSMAELKKLVEKLGFEDVRTLLNSGNVVFSADRAQAKEAAQGIQAALEKRLGVSARVTVLTAKELSTIVDENPLVELADDHSRLMVSIVARAADLAGLKRLAKQTWKPEALAIGSRAVYVWCPAGVLESPLCKLVAKELGDGVTSRNWATTMKLHALACAAK